MALHVTSVVGAPVAGSARRSTLGVSAAKANTTTASAVSASFRSLLAGRPVGSPATAVAQRNATAASPAASSTSTAGASPAATTSGLSDFELLFGGSSYNPADPMAASRAASATPAPGAATPPTAQSVFGPNVWMSNPIGAAPDGTIYPYNPIYFATQGTAQKVANMVGGTVVAKDMFTQPGNSFVQQQPNYMVEMPNGALINPGLVASFYNCGFSQSQINTMIAQEVANTPPAGENT